MKRWNLFLAAAAAAVAVPAAAFAADKATGTSPGGSAGLAAPVQVTADGKPVDVGEVGHAAPFFADFDGDGKRDLLVGNFGNNGQGKLLVFRNEGSDKEPKFSRYEYMKAGADLGTVPAS